MYKLSLLWVVVAFLALVVVPLPTRAAGEAIVVIANKAVSAAVLTRDELRPIFQTKKTTWPDGTPVRPFNLPEANAIRQGFDAAVLGLDPDRVARYWIDRKIRGGERPPTVVSSSALIVKAVAKAPGAIGYVESGAVDASVKVIARILDGQVVKP